MTKQVEPPLLTGKPGSRLLLQRLLKRQEGDFQPVDPQQSPPTPPVLIGRTCYLSHHHPLSSSTIWGWLLGSIHVVKEREKDESLSNKNFLFFTIM